MSVLQLLTIALAAFVGSTAQSATGFGVVLPLAPVVFAIEDPPSAVLTVAVAALAHNVLVIATRHRRLALRVRDSALLIATALPGVLIGAAIITHLSRPTMQVGVGVAVLAALAARLHQPHRSEALDTIAAGGGIGLVAGILTTTAGINGPPLVLWLRARKATVIELRDTLATVFLTLNVAAIPTLATRGASPDGRLFGALASGLLLGHAAGMLASHRTRPATLERALIVLLFVAGTASIAAGVAAA